MNKACEKKIKAVWFNKIEERSEMAVVFDPSIVFERVRNSGANKIL